MTNEAILNVDWPELIKELIELIVPRNDDILDSPAKLGSLLTICVQLAEIEPVVRERASTLALQKQQIPGWILIRRDGNRYVENQRVLELCLQCAVTNLQKLLTTLAMQLGNISEHRYRELCESAGLQPSKEAIKHSGAAVHLRRDTNFSSTSVNKT